MANGPRSIRAWSWFVAWTATGVIASFGIIGLLSVGLPLLVVAAAASAVLAGRADSRVGLWGLVSGASVAAGFLAWTNRGGPGEVCQTTGDVTSCEQQWNPIPFAVVALLLLSCGVVAFVAGRRRIRTG